MASPSIIKESKAGKKRKALIKLNKRLESLKYPGEKLTYINDKIKVLEDEIKINSILNTLTKDFHIINKIKLETEDGYELIDKIIISSKCIFLIEIKNQNKKYLIKDQKWFISLQRVIRETESPFMNLNKQSDIINGMLKEESSQLPIVKLAVSEGLYSTERQLDEIVDDNEYIITTKELNKIINEVNEGFPDILSQEDIDRISGHLLNKDSSGFRPITLENGVEIKSQKDFIQLADSNWEETVKLLEDNTFYDRLKEIDDFVGMYALERALKDSDNYEIALEKLTQNNPWVILPEPLIEVTPKKIKFDKIEDGEIRTKDIRINNIGRGILYGTIKSERINQSFVGKVIMFTYKLDTNELPKQINYKDSIKVKSNGGNGSIPVVANYNISKINFLKNALMWGAITSILFLITYLTQQFILNNASFFGNMLVIFGIVLSFQGICYLFFYYKLNRNYTISTVLAITIPLILFLSIRHISNLISFIFSVINNQNYTIFSIFNADVNLIYRIGYFGFLLGIFLLGVPLSFKKIGAKNASVISFVLALTVYGSRIINSIF